MDTPDTRPCLAAGATPATGVLSINNVSVKVGKKNLLQNITLTLKPGEVLSVLGPNGAGKSTLIKVINGER
ncbi:MAG: ATP-binding cassette domain-containing protein, partial [Endozoicomonas sp.]